MKKPIMLAIAVCISTQSARAMEQIDAMHETGTVSPMLKRTCAYLKILIGNDHIPANVNEIRKQGTVANRCFYSDPSDPSLIHDAIPAVSFAIRTRKLRALRALLEGGADANFRSTFPQTRDLGYHPLNYAGVMSDQKEAERAIELLGKHGANPDVGQKYSYMPRAYEDPEVPSYLQTKIRMIKEAAERGTKFAGKRK